MPDKQTAQISKEVIVFGSGSWGCALALHLERQQHRVVLWGHDRDEVTQLVETRQNDHYLPGISLPETIFITHDLAEAFNACADPILLVAVPSQAFESMLTRIQPFLKATARLVWATKGLTKNGEFLHDVCHKVLGDIPQAVISGPSFAKEVANHLPTAVTVACKDPAFSKELLALFHSAYFRIYLCDDIIGVELSAIVKNVLAIGVGMSDGLGFGANARAAMITRGLAELIRLGDSFGANLNTLIGLSGIGDIVLTCTDNQSRNRRFGVAIGEGTEAKTAQSTIGQVVEGQINAAQLMQLAQQQQVELPICSQVYQVLYKGLTPQQAMDNLLKRAPRPA